MKRIPIYSSSKDAKLIIRSTYTVAVDEIEYDLYLAKFFNGRKTLNDAIKMIEKERDCLIKCYENLFREKILHNTFYPLFDNKSESKNEESLNLKEALFRIIEFYSRILYLTRHEEKKAQIMLSIA